MAAQLSSLFVLTYTTVYISSSTCAEAKMSSTDNWREKLVGSFFVGFFRSVQFYDDFIVSYTNEVDNFV